MTNFKLFVLSVAMLVALTPSLAFARTRGAQAHMRPQLFHDRSAHQHDHSTRAHQAS
jgi:hypothetical protein